MRPRAFLSLEISSTMVPYGTRLVRAAGTPAAARRAARAERVLELSERHHRIANRDRAIRRARSRSDRRGRRVPRVATLGRSISSPPWRNGAVTMKMMSSTSTTSTSGVTLISAIGPRDHAGAEAHPRTTDATVEELARELADDVGEFAQPAEQVVVADHRRDRRRQPRDRGDQRLGDAGCDDDERAPSPERRC